METITTLIAKLEEIRRKSGDMRVIVTTVDGARSPDLNVFEAFDHLEIS